MDDMKQISNDFFTPRVKIIIIINIALPISKVNLGSTLGKKWLITTEIPLNPPSTKLFLVEKTLTALKIENSPSHTEVKLDSNDGLYVIETGARMGGDFISSDLVRLSTGYDFVEGAIKLAVNQFEVPSFTEPMFAGVYFYSRLAPEVAKVIKMHQRWPEIVEWYLSDDPLPEVKSNADRGGYFLYQKKDGRFMF